MKVLIFGGRKIPEQKATDFLCYSFARFHIPTNIKMIAEGGARGADRAGRLFGEFLQLPVKTYKADWNRYGKAAGPIRNEHMIRDFKPDVAIMFPGGTGTAHMKGLCQVYNVKIIPIGYFQDEFILTDAKWRDREDGDLEEIFGEYYGKANL
jgi:hypothetical protein